MPVLSCGPSSNTWPKWASQLLHLTSVRTIPKLMSFIFLMLAPLSSSKNAGHPHPLSNFCSDENKGILQTMQLQIPGLKVLKYQSKLISRITFIRALSPVLLGYPILLRGKPLFKLLFREFVVHATFGRKKISDQTSDFHYKLSIKLHN